MMDIIREFVIPALLSFAGALGLGVRYNIRRVHIVAASVGVMVCKLIYMIMQYADMSETMACFFAALAAAAYSEILARVFRSPVTMYLIVSIIPIVPGMSAYYTMLALVTGDNDTFTFRMIETFKMSGAIAIGIFLVPAVIRAFQVVYRDHRDDIADMIREFGNDDKKGIKKL